MSDLAWQSLSDVCRQIKSGALTSVTATETMLERIASHDASLKSYALVLADSAMSRAEALDAQRAAGGQLGPLHGVPIAIKDLLYTEGVPTASGTAVMADYRPTEDATVVRRLRDAGAVILGKTQLTEGAFGAHHPSIDPPKNPWQRDYWPGVSSSGSGVSVAAGMAYGALGSDTGGSIRFPSACCGLVGIKATYGRVSRHGAFALAESLDHIGPMTRTVEDAARLLTVIAGQDPLDATSLPDPVPNYAAQRADNLEGAKIGVDWAYVTEGVAPAVVDMLRQALAACESLGATITEVRLPAAYAELVASWGVTTAVECLRAHAQYYPAQRDQYGPVLAALLDMGLNTPQSAYDHLQVVRKNFQAALNDLFAQVDYLIAPCMTGPVPTVADMDTRVTEDESRAAFIQFTAPFDYSGHPTITLPLGLDAAGLPQGFQLVGPWLGEASLVRAGFALEAHLPAHPRPTL